MPAPPQYFGKADNLFSESQGSTDAEEFVPDGTYSESHPQLIKMILKWDLGLFELIIFVWMRLWTYSGCCNGLRLLGKLGWGKCILHVGKAWILESQRADEYGLNCFPQILWSYTLQYIGMWFYLKIGSSVDVIILQWGHPVRVEPNPIYWCPYQKRRDLYKEGLYHVTTKEGLKLSGHKPKNTKDCQKFARGYERGSRTDSPSGTLRSHQPCQHLDFTSGLRKCETVYFCSFKPPSLRYFLRRP